MRQFLKKIALLPLLTPLAVGAAEETVHIYNWNDYFAEDTLSGFQERTGTRAVLDLYDSNEILDAKLLAGSCGYDLVFPTARPFAARQIKAGIYQPLDKSKLPGLKNLDPEIYISLKDIDPDNKYLVPYMWGTTGLGINVDKVKAALGEEPVASWALVFDPEKAKKLASCGLTLFDDPTEVFAAALVYLGKDPNSRDKQDLQAAQDLIKAVHPYIRYFHTSQVISDLANGDICIAQGYSGDVLQSRDKANEAGNGVKVAYLVPKEGAVLWVDVMAIPKDAPNPGQSHAFIEYLLDPKVIANASNFVNYANPNLAATEFLDEAVRQDPGIYPSKEIRAQFITLEGPSDKEMRELNRIWTRLKANR
ncbi:MAG: polyamine ABC transporter substrate-binding protein [Chromatiaceae bacterium]|nr:polyamine ABC transporter substrate-binding protein [Chromatiaceae bacterium]MBP9603448.1 polyamine ABC transporter substrate-binding protein [Chromatiaceae bacterium]